MSKHKNKQKPRTRISLSPSETATLKGIQAAIEAQERALTSLRQALTDLLSERYGVDLIHDKWTLNLDEGTLRRDDSPPT